MIEKSLFVDPYEHFDALVESLNPEDYRLFQNRRHSRVEYGFKKRQFVVYECNMDGEPKILDVLTVEGLNLDMSEGLWATIHSREHRDSELIDYTPTNIFDWGTFVYLPLRANIKFDIRELGDEKGSLAFPLVVHTASRFHLREPEVTYMENMVQFRKEFGSEILMA